MVKAIHASTMKAAEKAGIIITAREDNSGFDFHWTEGNKRSSHVDAKAGLAEMKLWKMLTVEYKQLKVVLTKDGVFKISKGRTVLGEAASLQEAWEAAQDAIAPDADADEDGEGEEEGEESEEAAEGEGGRSIVKAKYRTQYQPFKHTCGDELTAKLRDYLETEVEGKKRIDLGKLRKLADKNKVWDERYENLNPGQQRMNVGNRIRKIWRNNPADVVWPR